MLALETPASASASRTPTSARDQPLSVWAFEEIFASSLPLALTGALTIRIPTVAGNATAKLGAWLDRSEWHESKDAAGLALQLRGVWNGPGN